MTENDKTIILFKLEDILQDKLTEVVTIQRYLLKGCTISFTGITGMQQYLDYYRPDMLFDLTIRGHIHPRTGPFSIAKIDIRCSIEVEDSPENIDRNIKVLNIHSVTVTDCAA